MDLCDSCQSFDIRALLKQSEAQELTKELYSNVKDYHRPIPLFHKLQPDLYALKQSSSNTSCKLCKLLWEASSKTLGIQDVSSATTQLWDNFKGELYIGSSGWQASRQGFPYVTLTQVGPSGGSTNLCYIEPFVERGGPPTDIDHLVGSSICRDSASPVCLEAASTWLNECLTNHTACSRAAPDNLPNLPTRVIDVGTDSISPQLIITNGRCGDYVALSYCWGGNSDFVLNTDRLPILQAGIPLVEWPKTLRDAIVVTRSLKIQYIWIDALCIQQDSKEDWSREASKMRDVYAQSLLTVSASRSPSTTFGIFSERDAKTDHCWINVGSENSKNKVYLRLGSELWDDTLRSSPLSGRGWTLQEGLLAPRTLSYGSQQMVWECSTHQVDEGGRSTLPTQDYKDKQSMQKMIKAGSTNKHKISKYIGDSLYSRVKNISHSPFAKQDSINTSDSYDRWYEIVQEFTTRSLTFVTDTLPAVSGIAQAFAPSLPPSTFSSQYIAGIWTGDIIGILWRRSIRHKVLDTNFTPEYLGPSWSWASLRDGLALASVVKQQRTALSLNWARDIAKVVGFEVELQSKDPFGCVSNGVMIIRGRFKVLSKCPSSLLSTLVQPMTAQTEKSKNSSELDLSPIERYLDESLVGDDKYEFLQKHREVSGQKFALLEIIRWKKASDTQEPGMDMLLLETADTKETEWRRIAMISVRKWLTRSANEQLSRTEMAQNEAFEDIMRGDWKKMTVRIV